MTLTSTPICLSGGAIGADEQWGMCAGSAGHQVFHFTFARHRTNVPQSEIVELTQAQLNEADPFLERANLTLGRRVPYHNLPVVNLLRRNWYQVRDSGSVYAVATIKRGLVSGGTSWATQMFIDQHDNLPCEAYVYDQGTSTWMKWEGRWVPAVPPMPTGIWAGIGSRDLFANGKQAIRELMGYRSNTVH